MDQPAINLDWRRLVAREWIIILACLAVGLVAWGIYSLVWEPECYIPPTCDELGRAPGGGLFPCSQFPIEVCTQRPGIETSLLAALVVWLGVLGIRVLWGLARFTKWSWQTVRSRTH